MTVGCFWKIDVIENRAWDQGVVPGMLALLELNWLEAGRRKVEKREKGVRLRKRAVFPAECFESNDGVNEGVKFQSGSVSNPPCP